MKTIAFILACATCVAASAAEPPVTVPTPAAPTSIPANRSPVKTPEPQPVMAELNDGSKVEFDADGTVWVLEMTGAKTPAPDGTLTLKDGTPFVVREGRRVEGPGDD